MSKSKITPFISMNGKSKEAMEFYCQIFPNTKITRLEYYKDSSEFSDIKEDLVLYGSLSIMGSELFFLDMQKAYPAPALSWSSSLYINCSDEEEFDNIFVALSKEGSVMMGPEAVGNIRKCAWVVDKFGLTWQPVWE